MNNLGKNWSQALSKLVDLASETAGNSCFSMKHGAVLFSGLKQIHQTGFNQFGHRACGYDVPSLHAEACCLRPIYNRAGRLGQCHQGSRPTTRFK